MENGSKTGTKKKREIFNYMIMVCYIINIEKNIFISMISMDQLKLNLQQKDQQEQCLTFSDINGRDWKLSPINQTEIVAGKMRLKLSGKN